jgi:hypothetical protein
MTNMRKRHEWETTYNTFCEESKYFSSLNGWDERSTLLKRIHRYETALHRINENDCNGHPRMKTEYRDGKMYRYEVEDQAWLQRDIKKEISIQSKVRDIALKLGFGVIFNGDPRGGSIRFVLPSGKSTGMDGKTWGIYW